MKKEERDFDQPIGSLGRGKNEYTDYSNQIPA